MKYIIDKLKEVERLIGEIRELAEGINNAEFKMQNGELTPPPLKRSPQTGGGASDSEEVIFNVLEEYKRLIGFPTRAVLEGIEFALNENMEPELIIRIIEYSVEQQKRSWQYIKAVIFGSIKENVLTVNEYNKRCEERAKQREAERSRVRVKVKRSRFNNYNDPNTPDYSNIADELMKKFMEE